MDVERRVKGIPVGRKQRFEEHDLIMAESRWPPARKGSRGERRWG